MCVTVCVFPAGVSVTCMLLSVCYVMRHCSVTVTTTRVDKTVSAAAKGSSPAAGDQDHTCPCLKALLRPVRTCTHTHTHCQHLYIPEHTCTHIHLIWQLWQMQDGLAHLVGRKATSNVGKGKLLGEKNLTCQPWPT